MIQFNQYSKKQEREIFAVVNAHLEKTQKEIAMILNLLKIPTAMKRPWNGSTLGAFLCRRKKENKIDQGGSSNVSRLLGDAWVFDLVLNEATLSDERRVEILRAYLNA